ncbi:MAG: hypothetical protein QXX94_01095 [Candidatus Bathyarchaeia archaeon]
MSSLIKRLIIPISIIVVIAGSLAYFLLFQQSGSPIEVASIEFSIDAHLFSLNRVIKIELRNLGDNNITVNRVMINDEVWNMWAPRNLLIIPKSSGVLNVYYPWNGREYKITVETSGGTVEFNKQAPEFTQIRLNLQNNRNEEWNDMVHFNMFFADGELSEPKIAVYEGENSVPCQIWGIVRYESGYIKTATITFMATMAPTGKKTYTIKLGEQGQIPPETGMIEITRRNENYVIISNNIIKIGFNEEYRGEIDFVSDMRESVNLARKYIFGHWDPNAGAGQAWSQGFLQSSLYYFGPMNALNKDIKCETYIETEGPLLAIYARKWFLRGNLGVGYEFFAIPYNNPRILYKFSLEMTGDLNQGPGAAPGSGYEYYNWFGCGGLAIPLLSVKDGTFFLTEDVNTYFPDWPGNDLWAKHTVAACINATYGAAIRIIGNDPVIPIGYWHVVIRRWPWDQDITSVPEIGIWIGQIHIAGIPEGKLCWTGQPLNNEPYAAEREITPRGTITLYRGFYSWLFNVEILINRDVALTLKDLSEYDKIEVSAKPTD